MLIPDFKYIFTGEANDINEMIAEGDEPQKGDKVSIEVQYVLDWYAELTETRRGSSTVTYHCMAVLDNGEIISICVGKNSAEYTQIDNLIEQTYEYLLGERSIPPTPVTFTGTVRKIDSKISDYYKSGLNLYGYSTSEAYMLNIDVTQTRMVSIIALFLDVLIIFIGAVFVIGEIAILKEKKTSREIEAMPVQPVEDPIFTPAFYDNHKVEDEKKVDEKPVVTNTMFSFKDEKHDDSDNKVDDLNDTSLDEHEYNEEQNEKTQSKFSLKKD